MAIATFVLGTVALTVGQYRALPSRVPLHFGFTGVANAYGPRPSIWVGVGVQLLLAAAYIALYFSLHERKMLAIGVGVSALILWAQSQIISAAISGTNALPLARYIGISVAIIAITAVLFVIAR